MAAARSFWRKFRAGWRDTFLLLREFRLPLVLFAVVITGSGWLFAFLSSWAGKPVNSLVEAMYITMTLAFFQPAIPFPQEWYLQVFFFFMPVIGIGILAQGLTDFGVLLFNRRARGKEWEMAVASTFNNHVVLIGLGHLGFRVVQRLRELEQEVVVVELAAEPDLLIRVRQMGVPVIEDDGTRQVALSSAGIERARAIILCTQNDGINMRMALKARSLNPKIEVVIRIFDDEFGASLHSQFGFHAMSATGMAAPLFAAIAAHIDVTSPITVEGQPHIMANMIIQPGSRLDGLDVMSIEEKYRVSVVLLCADGKRQYHPPGHELVGAGQTVAIFGEPVRINTLLHENKR